MRRHEAYERGEFPEGMHFVSDVAMGSLRCLPNKP